MTPQIKHLGDTLFLYDAKTLELLHTGICIILEKSLFFSNSARAL